MDKFLALSDAKRKKIIDAGMMVFGKVGYKKASTNDIAVTAGISKGMIFHYFGSKKQMYLYLVQLAAKEMLAALKKHPGSEITDFFDRILYGTEIKLAVLNKHPAMLKFLTSVYFELDSEVAPDLSKLFSKADGMRNLFVFSGMDKEKFKDSVNPELVLNILLKYTEGYLSHLSLQEEFSVDAMLKEFHECLSMMKNNFYKEEYL